MLHKDYSPRAGNPVSPRTEGGLPSHPQEASCSDLILQSWHLSWGTSVSPMPCWLTCHTSQLKVLLLFPPHSSLPLTLSQCWLLSVRVGGGRLDALLLASCEPRDLSGQTASCLKAEIFHLSTVGLWSGSFFAVQSCPAHCRMLKDIHGLYRGIPGCQWRRPRFDPWIRKISWRRNGNTFQYYCLENPMDRGAHGATAHWVWKIWTRLSYWTQAWSLHTWCLQHPPTKKVSRHCQPSLGTNLPLSENRCLNGTGQLLIKPKDRRQGSVISFLCEKDWEPTTRVMSEESSSVFKKPTLKCKLSVWKCQCIFLKTIKIFR